MRRRLALLGLAALAAPARAQLEAGGRPLAADRPPRETPTLELPALDVDELLREDAAAPAGAPARFGVPRELGAGPDDAGVWEELPDGSRVWRLRVRSVGARSIGLAFDRWRLPRGAELYVHDDAGSRWFGAFTPANDPPGERMTIRPFPGEAASLELRVPSGGEGLELRLAEIVHDYRGFYALAESAAVAPAGEPSPARLDPSSCTIDVRCPEGAGWEAQVDATVLVVVGGTLCSGSLVANTARDGAQLLLSAYHCGRLDGAVFVFRYERSLCGNGPAPQTASVQGSIELAADAALDVRLVQIPAPIPPTWRVRSAGWDRRPDPPASTATIHHPRGQPKAISLDLDPPVKTAERWRVVQWDAGVTEPGSSGAPLYDEAGRLRGQLCCGLATCGHPFDDDFGALVDAWPLLAPWLDPLGTGELAIDGFDPNAATGPPRIDAVEPDPIECLIPGTAATVAVLGAELAPDVEVRIDGVALPAPALWEGKERVRFDMPELASLGSHVISVHTALGSASATVTVVPPAEPRLQIGTGDAGALISSTLAPVVHGGEPGALHLLLGSTSTAPSVLPGRLELALGNAFAELVLVGPVWIGPGGLARGDLAIRPSQAINFRPLRFQSVRIPFPLRFPLPVGNAQDVRFLF